MGTTQIHQNACLCGTPQMFRYPMWLSLGTALTSIPFLLNGNVSWCWRPRRVNPHHWKHGQHCLPQFAACTPSPRRSQEDRPCPTPQTHREGVASHSQGGPSADLGRHLCLEAWTLQLTPGSAAQQPYIWLHCLAATFPHWNAEMIVATPETPLRIHKLTLGLKTV